MINNCNHGDEAKFNIEKVRDDELELILAKRKAIEESEKSCKPSETVDSSGADKTNDINDKAWDSGLVGLAFSGGGIRSATFNLGILQSLAKYKLLRRVDYLSTVSGGGYIGAWFSGLLQREHYRQGMEGLRKDHDDDSSTEYEISAIDVVEARLNPNFAHDNQKNAPEDPAITYLRSFSNYLTPKLGFFTADTWSLISTYLRNVLLNQTILILFIAALLLVPRLISEISSFNLSGNFHPLLKIGLLIPLTIIVGWFMGRNIVSVTDTDPAKPNPQGTRGLLFGVLMPLVIIAFLFTAWIPDLESYTLLRKWWTIFALVIGLNLVIWLTAAASAYRAFAVGWLPINDMGTWRSQSWLVLCTGVVAAAIVFAPALYGISGLHTTLTSYNYHGLTVLIIPPLMLLSVLLTAIFHVGLAAEALKSQQREWLSRLAAWMLILSISWFVFAGISILGPLLLGYLGNVMKTALVSGWVATTALGLLAGNSKGNGSKASFLKKGLASVAPYVFIAGLIVVMSASVQYALTATLNAMDVKKVVIKEDVTNKNTAKADVNTSNPKSETPKLSGVLLVNGKEKEVSLSINGTDQTNSFKQDIDKIKSFSGSLSINNVSKDVTLSFEGGSYFEQHQKEYFDSLTRAERAVPWLIPVSMFLLFFLSWFLSRRFDINEFSLHKMYENRLSRCFLGATTECRYANPFTGFSLQDDIPLWIEKHLADEPKQPSKTLDKNTTFKLGLSDREIDALPFKDKEKRKNQLASAYPGPYPLINTAINLVGGKRLAWQERKAASFILSPLYCGFQLPKRATDDKRCGKCNFCIRRFIDDVSLVNGKPLKGCQKRLCPSDKVNKIEISACLQYKEKPLKGLINWKPVETKMALLKKLFSRYYPENEVEENFRPTKDFASSESYLTLGNAIATSGAAASPSMGYHTTPALAFLTAVFNIRLGRWIGNPRKSQWKKSGPKLALWSLLNEVFGITNDNSEFVYLSDGGHFENLGIYELVQRRCRYIIACDAGADPDYNFEDLANAIRKCRIDFGVDIYIDVSEIQKQDEKGNNTASCTVGSVHYPDNKKGVLLYIKASLPKNVPIDVMQYALKHSTFPHQTTADQFFSESQFESYRRLGLHIGEQCLSDAIDLTKRAHVHHAHGINIETLFRFLGQRWYKRSSSIEKHFTNLASSLDSLFKQLSSRDELEFLDKQFYPEWRVLPVSNADVVDSSETDLSEGMYILPTDIKEFRAGFYFCSSLIQLMENVYHDLNLEMEHKHPDNSGWINMFKHWSWSGMFCATWAITSSTYGRRFRSFCERYLNLGLDADAIVAREVDFSNAEFRMLNVLEKWQINKVLEQFKNSKVYQIALAVNKPEVFKSEGESDSLLSFNFAYAVIKDNELIMYRVQDHLRNMGLGRRGLSQLIEKNNHLKFNLEGKLAQWDNKESPEFKELFTELSVKRSDFEYFNRLFESVSRF